MTFGHDLETATSRIGIDIGGTFTDVAIVDSDGKLRLGKHLTTHGAEGEGVLAALRGTAFDLSNRGTIVAHGTTLVINALLERKGARVGFVTTKGFADVLDIGRGNRAESYNVRYRRDPPLVPRELRFEVDERVRADGEVTRFPSPAELDALAAGLRHAGVESVAIGFLNAYTEPANEERVAAHLREALPGIPITLSSAMSRQWREYERFTTATANAYVAPVIKTYLSDMLDDLGEDGYNGRFVVLDSSGGAMTVGFASRFPVYVIESGPVAGVIGARRLAAEQGIENLIVFDMGGTTSKVSLVEDGEYATVDQYWVGGRGRGVPLQVSTVDVIEVSVGGGSIAWIDEAGRLRVGPQSAGSKPGPACYGSGGTAPTVADANLYCGRLDPEHFVGSLKLDRDAAAEVIEQLAAELEMPPLRLALGIIRLAHLQIAAAVRRQTLERGRDPRDFTLLAVGGAGPMHGCEVAAEAGIARVLVPPFPGHYSALGMLAANLRAARRVVVPGLLSEVRSDEVRRTIETIAAELADELRGDDSDAEVVFRYWLAMRYKGQDYTVRIPASEPGTKVPADLAVVFRAAFEAEYVRRYGRRDETSEIELVEIEVAGERALPEIRRAEHEFLDGDVGQISASWETTTDPVLAEVVPRGFLRPGKSVEGPAVIYEQGSTIVVPPGAVAAVIDGRTLSIDVSAL